MPAGRYLFIPFLRTKSQKRQTKNRSSEKSHKKKTNRTNIIATNFVWEQLKTVNIKVKLPYVNKKPLARKRIFVQKPFWKNFTPQKLVFFAQFVIWRERSHYSFLTLKIRKICEQILKKKAPQYNSNSLNCKKPREGQ